MGIPKFAAWLTRKFPDIASKECPSLVHGLYIDMNGIIHPCCHSEDDPSVAQRTDDEKIEQVCLCVQRLVESARPTRILHLAMDGVAPRAKMNQQRARRYMSAVAQYGTTFAPDEHGFTAEQRQQAHDELEDARKSLDVGLYGTASSVIPPAGDALASPTSLGGMGSKSKSQEGLAAMFPNVVELLHDFKHAQPIANAHHHTDPHGSNNHQKSSEPDETRFDSNCISPGTEFMWRVALRVREFVATKCVTDPLWAALSVVCSDTNTPGEGEHKLIDFIRSQSSYASVDSSSAFYTPKGAPRGAHVICGLDADLILLCLSLHLENVYIMRDVKRQSTYGPRTLPDGSKRRGTSAVDGPHDDDDVEAPNTEEVGGTTIIKQQRASTTVPLRPRSAYEYFHVDLIGDRLVSELRALCVATNFHVQAPHAFSDLVSNNGYPIRGPSLEDIQRGGKGGAPWNPCGSSMNFKLVDDFVAMASLMGNDFLPRIPSAYCGESAMDNFLEVYVRCVLPYGFLTEGSGVINLRQLGRFLEAYGKIECMLFRQHVIKDGQCSAADGRGEFPTRADEVYRKQYFNTTTINDTNLQAACVKYIEGLSFVWKYYSCTSEACSWSWYYPQHHAPFAVDLARVLRDAEWSLKRLPPPPMEVTPPSTFAQLLCILPPSSRRLLPTCLHQVMTNPPEQLEETFPSEWAVDYAGSNGKEHLSTVLLPFADMKALADVVESTGPRFTSYERMRCRVQMFHILIERLVAVGTKEPSTSIRRCDVALRGVDTLTPEEATDLQLPTNADDTINEGGGIRTRRLFDVAPLAEFRPRTYASTLSLTSVGGGDEEGASVPTFAQQGRGRGRGRRVGGGAPSSTSAPPRPVISKGMPLGDFMLAVCGMGLAALALTGFPLQATVLWVVSGALSFLLMSLLGAAQSSKALPTGSQIRRNQTRDAFVDWMCSECWALNFMRQERCFQCRAPADDVKCWAVFSGKLPQRPPPYDPNHAMHLMWAQIPHAPQQQSVDEHEVPATTTKDDSDADNCEML